MFDYVPGRGAPAVPLAPPPPDAHICRAVFPRLAARLAARRKDNLPISEQSLRADLALAFAAELGDDAVWPEALYAATGGPRLGLLVRPPAPDVEIGVEARQARRADSGQISPNARQFGDLLRDAVRLHGAFGEGRLPVQVLLCTDEFRTYLAGQRPPLRLLRPDSVGTEVKAAIPAGELEDTIRNRLAESLDGRESAVLRLSLDVLAYAPVGPLHLGMWRVAEARLT